MYPHDDGNIDLTMVNPILQKENFQDVIPVVTETPQHDQSRDYGCRGR